MRTIQKNIVAVSVLFGSLLLMSADWKTDFTRAKEEAKKNNKFILLCFSGSDWCIPCIKTRKEIFDKETFQKFAETDLVLVNADFPRLKKNCVSKELAKQNEALAEQYDKAGVFPYVLLLNADGQVLKEWKGYQGVSSEVFIAQIKEIEHSHALH